MDQQEKNERASVRGVDSQGLKSSVVDTLFDALTAHTAKGLVVTKDALESGARWLDARAKSVGDLATTLASPSASDPSAQAVAGGESA